MFNTKHLHNQGRCILYQLSGIHLFWKSWMENLFYTCKYIIDRFENANSFKRQANFTLVASKGSASRTQKGMYFIWICDKVTVWLWLSLIRWLKLIMTVNRLEDNFGDPGVKYYIYQHSRCSDESGLGEYHSLGWFWIDLCRTDALRPD